MTSLVAQGVTKHFGALKVLCDVTIEFQPGTVTALVGDNGAGKSTLLKLLAGSYTPDRGRILLGDEDLTSSQSEARRRKGIEMVYQDFALAKNQDIPTNLFLGRELTSYGGFLKRREMRRQAKEVLSKLEISIPYLDRPVGLLSGGQQQAVSIARAVMFDPSVLLLDEPTAALAAREVSSTLELIRLQRAAGRIVVLVSHRLNDVMEVADRVVVLKHGSVFSDDASSSVNIGTLVERIVS